MLVYYFMSSEYLFYFTRYASHPASYILILLTYNNYQITINSSTNITSVIYKHKIYHTYYYIPSRHAVSDNRQRNQIHRPWQPRFLARMQQLTETRYSTAPYVGACLSASGLFVWSLKFY